MGTSFLDGYGGATFVVGASHKPIISRGTLTSTLGSNRVTNTKMSILSARPPTGSGPLLATGGYFVAPRVT